MSNTLFSCFGSMGGGHNDTLESDGKDNSICDQVVIEFQFNSTAVVVHYFLTPMLCSGVHVTLSQLGCNWGIIYIVVLSVIMTCLTLYFYVLGPYWRKAQGQHIVRQIAHHSKTVLRFLRFAVIASAGVQRGLPCWSVQGKQPMDHTPGHKKSDESL